MVLGNVDSSEDVPPLIAALTDPEPLVRGHAPWALGKIASPEALEALRARASVVAMAKRWRRRRYGRQRTAATA